MPAASCRLYYTREDNVEEAAQLVEDAFRISSNAPESRELFLEVVGADQRANGTDSRGYWVLPWSWPSHIFFSNNRRAHSGRR